MAENKVVFEAFVIFNIQLNKGLVSKSKIIEKIQKDTSLNNIEKQLSLEAILVKIAADWQFYILNIFSYCIALNTDKLQNQLDLSLPKKLSFNNAYAILNGLNFFTFRSSSELKNLSKKYIIENLNPFLKIEQAYINDIDELSILRNYITHKSNNAKKRLLKFYQNNVKLKLEKDEFISPGEYLMKSYHDGQYEVRFIDSLLSKLSVVSLEIWEFLDKNSYEYIFKEYDELEKSYNANPEKMDLEHLENEFFRTIHKMNLVFDQLDNERDKK